MKIKDGFVSRNVGGETFVVAVGELSKTFNGIITLNETGKFIWDLMSNDVSEEEIVTEILKVCPDAEKAVVEADVKDFVAKLQKDGILE